MYLLIFQRLSIEFLLHIMYFPLWWYSAGLVHAFTQAGAMIAIGNGYLSPGLWLKNIFVPMFGQDDWQGRIMSFFMRFMNVIIRSALLFFWMILVAVIFFIWPALPVVVFGMFWRSLA